MPSRVPYDDFVDIYDTWCESLPIAGEMKTFYVELMCESRPPVVELGVGNGRICIEVAKCGQRVYGVDYSEKMLELCRSRAEEAGVADRLQLIHGDFRDFELPEPAALMVIPFHAVGHLTTHEDRRTALENIRGQLVPGGRLAFDHILFDPNYPIPAGMPYLRAETTDPESGMERLMWETAIRNMERRVIHLVVCTEDLDADGVVVRRRYRKGDLSWMSPEESRALLEGTGFQVEAAYGDYRRSPLDDSAVEQIWLARVAPA